MRALRPTKAGWVGAALAAPGIAREISRDGRPDKVWRTAQAVAGEALGPAGVALEGIGNGIRRIFRRRRRRPNH